MIRKILVPIHVRTNQKTEYSNFLQVDPRCYLGLIALLFSLHCGVYRYSIDIFSIFPLDFRYI